MKIQAKIFVVIASICLTNSLAISQVNTQGYYKGGWSQKKVDSEAKSCRRVFKKELCRSKASNDITGKVKDLLCRKNSLGHNCRCLSRIAGTLFSYKQFKEKNSQAALVMKKKGAFDGCLDETIKLLKN